MSYLELPQHPVSFDDADYMKRLRQRMQDRLNFIEAQTTNLEGFHALPQEATDVLKQVIKTLK
jgi:phosphoenolpyruvate carboxykinase (ATP)